MQITDLDLAALERLPTLGWFEAEVADVKCAVFRCERLAKAGYLEREEVGPKRDRRVKYKRR